MSKNNHFNLLNTLGATEPGLMSMVAENLDLIDFQHLIQVGKEIYQAKITIFIGILAKITEDKKHRIMPKITNKNSTELLKTILFSASLIKKQELFLRAAYGNVLLFSLLLHEFHINQKDEYGQTVLHEAAREGYFHLMHFLLAIPEIIVDARDKMGRTPLYCAVQSAVGWNDYKSMFLLVKAGADPYIQIAGISPPYYHLSNCGAPRSVIHKVSELNSEYQQQKTGRKYNSILENILKKIKTFTFKLNGGGVTVNGIDYPISKGAAAVFKLIKEDIFNGKEKINRVILETEYGVHASKIKLFLKNKTKPHSGSWFFGLGARDQLTADFYKEIIDSLSLHKQNNNASECKDRFNFE